MNANPRTSTHSRRDVILGATALGLAAPLALHNEATASTSAATVPATTHPVVGVWIDGSGPIFEYDVYHADGTFMLYNPWIPKYVGLGNPDLSVLAFGVWEPTGERTYRGTHRIAWIDASVTVLATFTYTGEVNEAGDQLTVTWKAVAKDSAGNVISQDAGTELMTRLALEPEEAATPES